MKKINIDIAEKSDELKKLIAEHPDYDICVLVGEDAHGGGDYYWVYATDIKFSIGEVLTVETPYDDDICTDRDDFEERMEEWLYDECRRRETDGDGNFIEPDEDAFNAELKEKIAEYEPYWQKCIVISADN